MAETKKIGIVTGGGDCAGLNAVISAIVQTGTPLGYEFIGFQKGWEGMLSPVLTVPLTLRTVEGIANLGGTILRTSNNGRFRIGSGTGGRVPVEVLNKAKHSLDQLEIEGVIALGGDGSLTAAMQLAELGINFIGVPKTIDNDLNSTDQTFGFSTAVQVATEAIDRVHTTAASHDRVMIVECMGQTAGWITLHAGLAGGAHAILIPEQEFQLSDLVNYLRNRRVDRSSAVIAIAEGAKIGGKVHGLEVGANAGLLFGGVSSLLKQQIEEFAPGEFEMRTVVLGHTQRGGTPNAEDRILSKRYGVAAMRAYTEGKFGQMVSLHNGEMRTVPILEAVGGLKLVTENSPGLQTAKSLGIFVQ